MKKWILIVIVLIIVAVAVIFGLRFFSGNQNQQPEIVVSSPQPNETIKSPLLVEGKARGTWYFEAVFPVSLLDGNGKEIARVQAQAQSDWTTAGFVNFKATIKFSQPTTATGTLVLENDNPSGLPEKSKKIEIPVSFASGDTIKVQAYFNNNNLDPEISCNKVFSIEREIPKTTGVARTALEELLKGVTEKEKANGFFTSINSGVKIQKLTIENGIAKVDFDEQLEFQVGGSCRVSAIRAQITQTLKQFSNVKEVIISINGRTEDILQP